MPDSTTTAPSHSRTANARVVVAARTRARREQLAAVLRRAGFKVRTGAPAAAAALVNRSDVVVLEWSLDISMLRSGPPVIALIPREHPDWVNVAVEAGVSDYVLGPVTTDELTARVRLASARASRTSARSLDSRATELTLRCATDGTIISATGSAKAMTGMAGDELMSLPWPGLAHPEEAGRVSESLAGAFAEAEGLVCETHRVRRKDGSYVWVETRCRVVSGVAEIVVRDVSGIRRERDRETGLRRLATMAARGEPVEEMASAAVNLITRLLDVNGAAVVGPDGPVAVSDSATAEAIVGDPQRLQVIAISRLDEQWGSVTIHRPAQLSAADTMWLSAMAEVIELGITRDGVASREASVALAPAAFAARLARETSRASRYGRKLALAVVGIVGEAGGPVADASEIAEQIEQNVRAGEVLAPISEHRVAWLLPESDALGAWQAVERMRFLRAQAGLTTAELTAGIAALDGDSGDPDRLLADANVALDVALRKGSDPSVVHTPLLATLAALSESDLGDLAEVADKTSGNSGRAMSQVATAIAAELGWSARDVGRLREAASIQNLGVAVLPVGILSAARELRPVELSLVQAHPATGARLAAAQLDREQQAWVHAHHERWDGDGYPDGLAADEVPEGALILGLADAWVAMASVRPHRAAIGTDEALAECERCSGGQFWPEAVDALATLVRRGRLNAKAA